MGPEWKAIGLRAMYGYMADLSTEPRWYRVHETFSQDADLTAQIMKTLVENLQGTTIKDGTSVNRDTAVVLTLKHFPGGGPQELGMDPHYAHGKEQVYPGGKFEYHFRPFKAAIDAGVSSIMPYPKAGCRSPWPIICRPSSTTNRTSPAIRRRIRCIHSGSV